MRPPSDTAARTGPLWVWPALAVTLLLAAGASGGEDTGAKATEPAGPHLAAAGVAGGR